MICSKCKKKIRFRRAKANIPLEKWDVRWDSGGCHGSDTLGTVMARDEDHAWRLAKKLYYTGEPYNDDNIYVRKARVQDGKQGNIQS